MKDTSEENVFNYLWQPGQLEELNLTNENTRVILSLGDGSSVQQARTKTRRIKHRSYRRHQSGK